MTKVSVVGLGKLGACMAACLASKRHTVVGVDCEPTTVKLVNQGEPPLFEPGLAEITSQVGGELRATSDYGDAINESEITFIVVPTPSEEQGGFSLRYVERAAGEIGRALKHKSQYHLVVLTSTVLPGTSDCAVIPILESASGKCCGRDFGFCYGPEFIALGSVIRDFLNPDFVLIGEFDRQSGEILASLYGQVCDNHAPIARMSLINAELAKIAVNTYVTMKVTFANMVAALCEALPGGDVDQVTQVVGMDKRIGQRYLRGALGYGGPCFPRDNLALAFLARQLGQSAPLAEATDAYNRGIVERVVKRVMTRLPHGTVAVLGLAYKPNTVVVEESQSLELARRLAERGLDTLVYDPLALGSARKVLGDSVRYAESLEQCVEQADVLIVASPEPEFERLHAEIPLRSHQVVFDTWRLLRQRLQGVANGSYLASGWANTRARRWHTCRTSGSTFWRQAREPYEPTDN